MLKSLNVWNFALLEHVEVEFGPGLNILTGETGAGKSILIDSLGAILGKRISSGAIRTGCDWLRIEAVFSMDDVPARLKDILAEQAIEPPEDDELIITRQVTKSGHSSVVVNGCRTTLKVLKSISSLLVDIHGQNENMALLREESQQRLLDNHSAETEECLRNYRQVYSEWHKAQADYKAKQQATRDYAQRLDMLRWQDKEISDAGLQPGEEDKLRDEIKKLSHAEKISDYVQESYALLANGSRGSDGIVADLYTVKKNLQGICEYDDSLRNALQIVDEASTALDEAVSEIRDYMDDMDYSPERLDELQSRMDVIYKLEHKYGATEEDVRTYQAKIKAELSDIENYDDDMAALKKKIEALTARLEQRAGQLTQVRRQAAEELSAVIGEQIRTLGMPKATFHIRVEDSGSYGPVGADEITMYFSANPGEREQPLAEVASGGELSRIALAIKAASAARDDSAASLVFDEIDTGIGGRTAQMVAERIALVARYRQVLCITHLPQIASMADRHIHIVKTSTEESTATSVQCLDEEERVAEIARMASGSETSVASLDNARDMLARAARVKEELA